MHPRGQNLHFILWWSHQPSLNEKFFRLYSLAFLVNNLHWPVALWKLFSFLPLSLTLDLRCYTDNDIQFWSSLSFTNPLLLCPIIDCFQPWGPWNQRLCVSKRRGFASCWFSAPVWCKSRMLFFKSLGAVQLLLSTPNSMSVMESASGLSWSQCLYLNSV